MNSWTIVNVDGFIVRVEGTGPPQHALAMLLASHFAKQAPVLNAAMDDLVVFGQSSVYIDENGTISRATWDRLSA